MSAFLWYHSSIERSPKRAVSLYAANRATKSKWGGDMAGVNWDSIKAEYLKGGATFRKLSETHNIPYVTIRGRAAKRGVW